MNTANQIENQEMQEEKVRSLWKQSLIQFKHNRLAVAGFVIILLFIVVILATIGIDLATNYAFYDEYIVKQDLTLRLAKPSLAHPFGCDQLGRDILSRTMEGAGSTLMIALAVLAIGFVAGLLIGALCGLLGGGFTALNLKLVRLRDAVFSKDKRLKLLEPLLIITIFVTLGMLLPLAFPCTPTSCVMREGEARPCHRVDLWLS